MPTQIRGKIQALTKDLLKMYNLATKLLSYEFYIAANRTLTQPFRALEYLRRHGFVIKMGNTVG